MKIVKEDRGAKVKLEALDGMRGFAASYVVLHHMSTNRLLPQHPLLLHGSMLVDAFFVISGFVLAYQYTWRLRSVKDALFFVRKRFARIWPLHAAILLVMIAPRLANVTLTGFANSPFLQMQGDHSMASWFASILLIHAMGIYKYGVWNGPSWTLSVEFFAYIVFAISLLIGQCRRKYVLNALWGGLIVLSILILFKSNFFLEVPVKYSFVRCVFGFFTGAFAFRAMGVVSGYLSHSRTYSTMLELICSIGVIALIWVGPGVPLSLIFPAVCALLVLVLAVGNGILRWILGLTPFQALGVWSLGIYLLHIPLFNVMRPIEKSFSYFGLFSNGTWGWLTLVLYLVFVLILSAFSHRVIEVPARRILTGRARTLQPSEPVKSDPERILA